VLAHYVREGNYGDVQLDGLSFIESAAFEGNLYHWAEVTIVPGPSSCILACGVVRIRY
jgi:hypothetical protein